MSNPNKIEINRQYGEMVRKGVVNSIYGVTGSLDIISNTDMTNISKLYPNTISSYDMNENYSHSILKIATQNYNLSQYMIKDLEIIVPNKVIRVTFNDNTFEKAVCHDEDVFNLEIGISICILKKVFGSSQYHKLIRNAIKSYDDKCKKIREDELKNKAIEAKREKNHMRKLARKLKKEKENREARIREQAEAIVLASKMIDNELLTNVSNTKNEEI